MLIGDIRLKRVYQHSTQHDGARWLVDQVWPRGKREEELSVEQWYRAVAPSRRLRDAWESGRIDRVTFERRYRLELNPGDLEPLLAQARQRRLTLVSAVRDLESSHLPILREVILEMLREEGVVSDSAPVAEAH
ncbi:DUF488 domain-containing protein [Kushneria indalinina]|uniref:Uncharacterized protein YeaO (DUF488 family) n=1 Tax=Kushneria indalinina DSM 14324 TaxID=1122140 RepID=A0A3D9DSA7_9GAMM|nr:DUF488 family protein [Kushneria indalinina]REC93627.1 uncharacterized protein YeaO (DUF488 family) [Kushneria indalinina DSM 14324]